MLSGWLGRGHLCLWLVRAGGHSLLCCEVVVCHLQIFQRCDVSWCYHWSGASCWVASPQQTPHPALLGECQVVLAGGMVLAPPLHDLVLLPVHGHELVSPSVHPGGGHLPELGHGG